MDHEANILELKREKRVQKTTVTKTKHCAQKSDFNTDQINLETLQLWDLLEESLLIMDDLTTVFIKIRD